MRKRILATIAAAALGGVGAPMALAHTDHSGGCPNSPHNARGSAYAYQSTQHNKQVAGLDGRADNGGWAEVGVSTSDPSDFYVVANNPSPQDPDGVRQVCVTDEDLD